LNRNQFLILSEVCKNNGSISSVLIALSDRHGIPLLSLKLNSKVLKKLGLIEISRRRPEYGEIVLSEGGRFVLDMMDDA